MINTIFICIVSRKITLEGEIIPQIRLNKICTKKEYYFMYP